MSGTQFQEIEHKFIVSDAFNADVFDAACRDLKPKHDKSLRVRDTYYVLENRSDVVLRHRLDAEIQQLTLKTREVDSEVRVEVNLALDNGIDQTDAVQNLLKHMGVAATYDIEKDIQVFEFDDCEIVRYRASHAGREVFCVEFEAVGCANVEVALSVLHGYETQLGFDSDARTPVNLLDLLVPENPIHL
ncbi:MAG: CYTH domain-containing protein [Flavobacteriales bacterium]